MPLNHYLMISGLLFALGLTGVIMKRNLIIVFMCLEMMLSAGNLTLVAFARFHTVNGLPDFDAQSLLFFIITVAAAEVAVGLAIIVALFRARGAVNTNQLHALGG